MSAYDYQESATSSREILQAPHRFFNNKKNPYRLNHKYPWVLPIAWDIANILDTARAQNFVFELISANNRFVFVVGKRKIISGVIFDVESESEIRVSLSRQDFEIFEAMCSKNGVFRYFWGYVQGARNFFGFFLKCHHLSLLFTFKMSYWVVTSDLFFTKIRPYQVLTFIQKTLWAFTITVWCIPFCIRKFILKIWHFHF